MLWRFTTGEPCVSAATNNKKLFYLVSELLLTHLNSHDNVKIVLKRACLYRGQNSAEKLIKFELNFNLSNVHKKYKKESGILKTDQNKKYILFFTYSIADLNYSLYSWQHRRVVYLHAYPSKHVVFAKIIVFFSQKSSFR